MKIIKLSTLVVMLVIVVSACSSKNKDNPLTAGAWKCDSDLVTFDQNGNFKLVFPNGETVLDTYSVDKNWNIKWGGAKNPYNQISKIEIVTFRDLVLTGPYIAKTCTK